MTSFTYHHVRTDCVYVVHIDVGRFHSTECHIDRIGSDPIIYDELEEVPNGVRQDIEQLIEERMR